MISTVLSVWSWVMKFINWKKWGKTIKKLCTWQAVAALAAGVFCLIVYFLVDTNLKLKAEIAGLKEAYSHPATKDGATSKESGKGASQSGKNTSKHTISKPDGTVETWEASSEMMQLWVEHQAGVWVKADSVPVLPPPIVDAGERNPNGGVMIPEEWFRNKPVEVTRDGKYVGVLYHMAVNAPGAVTIDGGLRVYRSAWVRAGGTGNTSGKLALRPAVGVMLAW